MFLTVFLGNDGQIRGYIILGVIIGVLLYALLLSKIVISTIIGMLKAAVKVFKITYRIISYPVLKIIKIVNLPVHVLGV
jgi:hypothetical protein